MGDTVGDKVRDKVGDKCGRHRGRQRWRHVGATVGVEMGDKKGDKVGDNVADKVPTFQKIRVGETGGDIVRDKLGDKVRDTVGDKLGDKVRDTVGDKLGDKLATWETRFQGSQNPAHTCQRRVERDTTACFYEIETQQFSAAGNYFTDLGNASSKTLVAACRFSLQRRDLLHGSIITNSQSRAAQRYFMAYN